MDSLARRRSADRRRRRLPAQPHDQGVPTADTDADIDAHTDAHADANEGRSASSPEPEPAADHELQPAPPSRPVLGIPRPQHDEVVAERDELRELLEAREALIDTLYDAVEQRDAKIADLDAALDGANAPGVPAEEFEAIRSALEEHEVVLDALYDAVDERQAAIGALNDEVQARDSELDALYDAVDERDRRIEELRRCVTFGDGGR